MNPKVTKKVTKKVTTMKTSEKTIERYLCDKMASIGGIALKYTSDLRTGYPDRLCLLPDGRVFWVELKSKGKHPRAIQSIRISELREMGQRVYVADSKEMVDLIVRKEVGCEV